MDLYIQVADGQTVNHPAFSDNLIEAFGSIPNDWQPFTRIMQPPNSVLPVGVYQVAEVSYVQSGNGWKDSWSARDMTEDEKNAKIATVQSVQPYPSWTFDITTCSWNPPTPRPSGVYWQWNEASLSWVDATPPEMQLSSVSFT